MNDLPGIYTDTYTVRTYDMDVNRHMTLPALLRVINEAAMQNVIALKLSFWDLEKENLSWILLRLNLKIYQLPVVGQKLKISTYPTGIKRLFTFRDYKVWDEEGNLMAATASAWILMDTKTRRPARIPAWIHDRATNLGIDIEPLPRPKPKLPPWEGYEYEHNTTVGWHDLDFNMHLNNNHYLRLILDSLPVDVLEKKQLTELQIHYQNEAYHKDQLVSRTGILSEEEYHHELLRGEQVLARAVTRWE